MGKSGRCLSLIACTDDSQHQNNEKDYHQTSYALADGFTEGITPRQGAKKYDNDEQNYPFHCYSQVRFLESL